jgi:hypothetical protein
MRWFRTFVASALSVGVVSASAQTITIQTGERSPDAAKISTLRVQTQVHLNLPATNLQSVEEQKAQQEAARRALYEIANRECRLLREVFGTDCRIVTMNVSSNVQNRQAGAGAESVMANGNVTYDLFPAGRP